MSAIITPSEQLEFYGPFTRICKQSLHVRNPGTEPIMFKVKTTAPKQYCVRPNAGRIEANSEIEVQIILQPFKEELPEDYKCKDKFLVQTAPIPAAVEQHQQDITSMWNYVEAEEKANLHQQKIRCVFVNESSTVKEVSPIPEPVTNTDNGASSNTIQQDHPVTVATNNNSDAAVPNMMNGSMDSFSSPTSTTTTTAPAPIPAPAPVSTTTSNTIFPPNTITTTANINSATDAAPAPPAPAASVPVVSSPSSPPVTELDNNNTTTPHRAAPPPPPPAVSSTREVNSELKDALEKIARLEKQLAELNSEEGLRARNKTDTRKLASTVQPLDAVHQHLAALEKPRPTEGYPPQVVLGVALFVFIFTYIFF
ncbi:MAG: PapD-like protein [Benjaminiella poitrasii]|nr:MAG: PapD-like protein [Benjaminiella poitrasii]